MNRKYLKELSAEGLSWDKVKERLGMLSGNFPAGRDFREMQPYYSFENDALFARALLLIMEKMEASEG